MPTRQQLLHFPKVLSPRERYIVVVLLIITLIGLIVAPVSAYYHYTKSVPGKGGTFTEGMIGQPTYINPLLSQTNDVDKDLANLIFAGLTKYDTAGNIVGDMAEMPVISSDGLTYTFKLKPDLKFHDGTPVTADDVIFTVLLAQNADYRSYQRVYWHGVDVTKIDNSTVAFKLKERYGQFLSVTTMGILSKHAWENVKPANFALSTNNLAPIGSGPYRLTDLDRDAAGIRGVTLKSFKDYAGGQPHVSTINLKFYDSESALTGAYSKGEINALSLASPRKSNTVGLKGQTLTLHLKLPRYYAVFFNSTKQNALADRNVRQALSYATDRKAIVDEVLDGNGTVANSPMIPNILPISQPKVTYEYDTQKALGLFAKSDWILSQNSKILEKTATQTKKDQPETEPEKFNLEITTANLPELIAAAEIVKRQWTSIGVNVTVRPLGVLELQQTIKDRDYQALLFGEILGVDPNPLSFWHTGYKKDPGLNLALYSDTNADKILENTQIIMDRQERLAQYAKLQDIILEDAPAVFLYSPDYIYAIPTNLKTDIGSVLSMPSDRYETIENWYLKTTRVWR